MLPLHLPWPLRLPPVRPGLIIILSTLASFLSARNASRLTVREVLTYE